MTNKVGPFKPLFEDHFPLSPSEQKVVDDFHNLYFRLNEKKSGLMLSWMGYQTGKLPGDLWVYQELICELQPEYIIECGTHRGGSALFFAHMMDLVGVGKVVSVDLYPKENRPEHDRIHYVEGSSTAPETLRKVESLISPKARTLVILDSNHTFEHVYAELQSYCKYSDVLGLLVVEDSFLNGNPSHSDFGDGPMEAIDKFLIENHEFEVDRSYEKFLFTLNPRGFLKRRKA